MLQAIKNFFSIHWLWSINKFYLFSEEIRRLLKVRFLASIFSLMIGFVFIINILFSFSFSSSFVISPTDTIFVTATSHTATPPPLTPVIPDPLQMQGLGELFERIVFAIFIILITILPLILLYGGIILMTSGGAPEKVAQAKKIILYAAVGLIIVLFARAIVPMIRFIIGGSP